MPSPPPLQPNTHYHIFNRGTNRENLFRDDENYRYFLKLYTHHIVPVAETFAYCLMPNHFHVLVRTKSEEEIVDERLTPSEGVRRLSLRLAICSRPTPWPSTSAIPARAACLNTPFTALL